jgi:hypothetical protein
MRKAGGPRTKGDMLRLTQMDDATIAALSGLDQAEVAALRQAAR